MDNRIKQHSVIVESLKGTGLTLYTIPVDQVFRRAQTAHKPIQMMDPKPETVNAIRAIAADIIAGGNNG